MAVVLPLRTLQAWANVTSVGSGAERFAALVVQGAACGFLLPLAPAATMQLMPVLALHG